MDIFAKLSKPESSYKLEDHKHLLASSLIILVALAMAIGSYFWSVKTFSQNYHPLLSEDKEFYFSISPNSSMLSEMDTLFVILGELTG